MKNKYLSYSQKQRYVNIRIPVFMGMTAFLLLSTGARADEISAPIKPVILQKQQDTAPIKAAASKAVPAAAAESYKVGVDDILDIAVLQPESIALTVTVSPDGSITFPYIGKVNVKSKTPAEIQKEIQMRLAEGYLKYPVVSVALRQSQSKKFFVYGEIVRPGAYLMEDNMTVLKAISTAGGFTKYGTLNRVKILRPGAAGYDTIKINMRAVMDGFEKDAVLEPGDIVQVEEGLF